MFHPFSILSKVILSHFCSFSRHFLGRGALESLEPRLRRGCGPGPGGHSLPPAPAEQRRVHGAVSAAQSLDPVGRRKRDENSSQRDVSEEILERDLNYKYIIIINYMFNI